MGHGWSKAIEKLGGREAGRLEKIEGEKIGS
jgi:hypothetical protein